MGLNASTVGRCLPFSAKPSKVQHDGTQFLFSSSEDFTLAAWTGLSERVDDVAVWILRYLLVFRAVYDSATHGMVEEKREQR